MKLDSNSIDRLVRSIENVNKNISKISLNTQKNMTMFETRLKRSETLMSRMAKSAASMSTSLRLASVAFAGILLNKAISGFTNALSKYGSAGANYKALVNQSKVLKDQALSSAFKIHTDDTQNGLQSSLGRFATKATVNGSEEQALLAQLGVDGNQFASMDQIDRLQSILKILVDNKNNIHITDLIEQLTGKSSSELFAIHKLMPEILKDYKKNLNSNNGVNSESLTKINQEWERLLNRIVDITANIFSKVSPYIQSAIEQLNSIINKFIENGGLDALSNYIKKLIIDFTTNVNKFKDSWTYEALKFIGDILFKSVEIIVWFVKSMYRALKYLNYVLGSGMNLLVDGIISLVKYIHKALSKIPFIGIEYNDDMYKKAENFVNNNYQTVFNSLIDTIEDFYFDTAKLADTLFPGNDYYNKSKKLLDPQEYINNKYKSTLDSYLNVFIRNNDVNSQIASPIIKQK